MSVSSHKANLALRYIEGIVLTQLDFMVARTAAHEIKWVDGVKSKYVIEIELETGQHYQQVYTENELVKMYESDTTFMHAGQLIKNILKMREKELTSKK